MVVQALGKRSNKSGRHVLHQKEAGRHVGWNVRQHLLQGGRSSGGNSNRYGPLSTTFSNFAPEPRACNDCRRSRIIRVAVDDAPASRGFQLREQFLGHRAHVGRDRAIRLGDKIEGPQLQAFESSDGCPAE